MLLLYVSKYYLYPQSSHCLFKAAFIITINILQIREGKAGVSDSTLGALEIIFYAYIPKA